MKRFLTAAMWFAITAPIVFFVSIYGDCGSETSLQMCGAGKRQALATSFSVMLLIFAAALVLPALRKRRP